MRVGRTILLILLAVLIIASAYGVVMLRRGFSARETPSAIETLAAATARKLAMPAGVRQLRNPFASSQDNIRAGMAHFADHCATCHGNDGSGDTLFGKGLYPKPPDMRTPITQNKTDGELYYTIENGIRLTGMPAFGEGHSPDSNAETWHLVLFIRHLPQVTLEEIEEMKRLNPKTESDRLEEQQEEEFLKGGEQSQDPAGATHTH